MVGGQEWQGRLTFHHGLFDAIGYTCIATKSDKAINFNLKTAGISSVFLSGPSAFAAFPHTHFQALSKKAQTAIIILRTWDPESGARGLV